MTPTELEWMRNMLRKYISLIDDPIVDVGSRYINGNSFNMCQEMFPTFKWIGLDYYEGPSVTLISPQIWTSQDKLPFEDESIGTVICNNTLEHVPNPIRMVEEIFRVLKTGRIFILTLPSEKGIYHHEAGVHANELTPDTPRHHYWQITKECVRDVLFKQFEILETPNNLTIVVNGVTYPLNIIAGVVTKKKVEI